MESKEILKECIAQGFLLDKEILDSLAKLDDVDAGLFIKGLRGVGVSERVITKSVFKNNFDKFKMLFFEVKEKKSIQDFFAEFDLEFEKQKGGGLGGGEKISDEKKEGYIKILSSPCVVPKKVGVEDFVKHFRSRYEMLSKILQQRNFEGLMALRRLGDDRETGVVIVAVLDKRITKNGNLLFEVEDLSGAGRVLVNKSKEKLYAEARNILPDDVVAFSVVGNKDFLFANEVIFPDAFLPERKKGDKEEWVVFLSDLHIGSTMFLEKNLLKFIKWVNGGEGEEEQRKIAKKVKYIFVTGDSIDGVGVTPGQEVLLTIKETKAQYVKLVELLKLIRKDIKIIIAPGQHDAVWVGEPQPSIGEYWAEGLYKMENVELVTNPALVEIDFGFKVLMYHGASMHGILEEMPEMRLKYGHNYPTKLVAELMKRRHLAPIHGSADYVPNEKKDPLAIDVLPDIVATGDWHRAEVEYYNNILLVASSCWQSITPFEEKVGNNPDPCKVPIFNLKTREVKILDFSDEDSSRSYSDWTEDFKKKQVKEANEIRELIQNAN